MLWLNQMKLEMQKYQKLKLLACNYFETKKLMTRSFKSEDLNVIFCSSPLVVEAIFSGDK